jgi:arsenate reductase
MTADPAKKPSVLFVCEHNAGRSQMAAGFLTSLSRGAIEVRSVGIQPSHEVSPSVVEAMADVGVDISGAVPKALTTGALQEADVVITMGCGDECPVFPGKRYEDWEVADARGRGIESVRPVRDEIRTRVEAMVTELLPARHADAQ